MTETADEIVLTREELYTRVWSTPMQKLAAEFGLSDVGLAKICKRYKIPRPSRGYWAKVERGKKVDQWPLLPVKDDLLRCIRLRKSMPMTERKAQPQLAADPEIERLIAAELAPENRIQALTDLRGANAAAEVFQCRTTDSIVEWEDVLAAMPDFSLNELAAFEDRKQRERTRNDCKTSAESGYHGPHFAKKRTAFERT